MADLPLETFRDELGTGEWFNPRTKKFEVRAGRSAESKAAGYLLKHRRGPANVSINHPDRMAIVNRGQSHPIVDVEATCDLIELAAEVIPVPERAAVLVAIGWNLGVGSLRLPAGHEKLGNGGMPWLARAGFPAARVPEDLNRHKLRDYAKVFRGALIAQHLVAERDQATPDPDEPGPRERRYTLEEHMDEGEVPLRGYPAIGKYFKVNARTARRWAKRTGMPLHQLEPGQPVYGYPSELSAWRRTWGRSGPVETAEAAAG